MPDHMPPLRILSYIRAHPWAMEPSAFGAMLEVVQLRAQGVRLSKGEKKSRIEAARRTPAVASTPAVPGGVAVIPLMGVLMQRADMLQEVSGVASCEKFCKKFQEAVQDPNVGGIVLHIDSGGGSVFGIQETAAIISAARGPKPIIAVANSTATSAAYWLASACDELVVAPGGQVGSIGIICCHQDMSEMDKILGVKMTYVTAPEGGFKSEGNPDEPLSDEARSYLQATVNEYYKPFVDAVASGRRVSAKTVRQEFGKGRMVTAAKAVELGMADRIATLQEVVDGMVPKKGSGSKGGRAEGEVEITAEALTPSAEPADLILARARVALAGGRRIA
jgi:signal peptide peptidase SppA